jgi:PilZ domain/Transposase zinc-ribbon domain
MAYRSRARRVSLSGVRVQLADMAAHVVNVSRTGALVRAGRQLRPGSDWPLTLELNDVPVQLTGRVVRLERAAVTVADGAVRRQFGIALVFVEPASEVQELLESVCGKGRERLGGDLGVCHLSFARVCPRCGSRSVSRQRRRRRYTCDACQRNFVGLRLGPFRLAL